MSMNLLNWGVYGPVAESKVVKVCEIIEQSRPQLLCCSEVGPGDAVEQLTEPLKRRGLHYRPISVGTPNSRGIRNAILGLDGVHVLQSRLNVPIELTLPKIELESFEMGGMRLRLSREPLAVLARLRIDGGEIVCAVGFFHPKSKYPEDFRTGQLIQSAPNQTFVGVCKMISSLRNFGQCLLAREFVDRFFELNPLQPAWSVHERDVRFVLVGDWNANPQEEQRLAVSGYLDGGLTADTVLIDGIGTASTDMRDICTIPWGGRPNSFDAIYVDPRMAPLTESRIVPVDAVDFFPYPPKERDRLENEVLDHRPVGLYSRTNGVASP